MMGQDGMPAGRAAYRLVQAQARRASTPQLTVQLPHSAEEMFALTTEEARGEGRSAVQDFTLAESFSASPCSFCRIAGSARVPRTQSQLLASPLHP